MEQKRFVSSAAAFRGDANANTKGLLRARRTRRFPASRASSATALESILRESRCEKEAGVHREYIAASIFLLKHQGPVRANRLPKFSSDLPLWPNGSCSSHDQTQKRVLIRLISRFWLLFVPRFVCAPAVNYGLAVALSLMCNIRRGN